MQRSDIDASFSITFLPHLTPPPRPLYPHLPHLSVALFAPREIQARASHLPVPRGSDGDKMSPTLPSHVMLNYRYHHLNPTKQYDPFDKRFLK